MNTEVHVRRKIIERLKEESRIARSASDSGANGLDRAIWLVESMTIDRPPSEPKELHHHHEHGPLPMMEMKPVDPSKLEIMTRIVVAMIADPGTTHSYDLVIEGSAFMAERLMKKAKEPSLTQTELHRVQRDWDANPENPATKKRINHPTHLKQHAKTRHHPNPEQ